LKASSFQATTVIAIRYNNHVQTFSSRIFVFTALFLFSCAKRGSNVTAAADGSTSPVILVSLSAPTVLLSRQKSRSTGLATFVRTPRLHLKSTRVDKEGLEERGELFFSDQATFGE